MIQLESNYIEAYLPQADVEEAMRSNEALLARAQRGEAEYEGSLGWHDPEKWASGEKLAQFCALGEEIRENAEVLVLLGVGGSNNAARAVIEALGSRLEVVYAGTSTSPYTIDKAIARCEGQSVYCIVIAKNFETLEPGIAFRSFRAYLRGRYGATYARRILAIGTSGSSMEALCKENGIRFLPFATDIGGQQRRPSANGGRGGGHPRARAGRCGHAQPPPAGGCRGEHRPALCRDPESPVPPRLPRGNAFLL